MNYRCIDFYLFVVVVVYICKVYILLPNRLAGACRQLISLQLYRVVSVRKFVTALVSWRFQSTTKDFSALVFAKLSVLTFEMPRYRYSLWRCVFGCVELDEVLLYRTVHPCSGEMRTQKLKCYLLRTQNLKVLPLKPKVGKYIAIRATLTV